MKLAPPSKIEHLKGLYRATALADEAATAVIAAHVALVNASNDREMISIVELMQAKAKMLHQSFRAEYQIVADVLDEAGAEYLHNAVFK